MTGGLYHGRLGTNARRDTPMGLRGIGAHVEQRHLLVLDFPPGRVAHCSADRGRAGAGVPGVRCPACAAGLGVGAGRGLRLLHPGNARTPGQARGRHGRMSSDPRMSGLAPELLARVHAGARALRDGDPARAERLLMDAASRAPAHAEPLRYLAILQLHTRRAALAVATLQRALAIDPGDALLHCDLGTAQSACGDMDAALAD
ncbi:MAG: tetratricopeptide repeat protein, partial [Rubrivivax sp.]